ncbi:MAG: 16S rRNA pseudouridine(516) synthase [Clostridia bacterium]|nr:16S rRNA pseudouridine(516) synthase [Clostridia bacterium]
MNISRSAARQMIRKGAVEVNGEKVFAADLQLDINNDELKIGGKVIVMRKYLYIMLNKPSGVLSAAKDPDCPTVIDLMPPELSRRGLFPAGRLDKDTTGLLVITDDGDFAHRLISPSHHVYKTYEATLESEIGEEELDRIRAGITLGDGTECLPARVSVMDESSKLVRVQIREGKYHQVKRMFAAVGNSVEKLHRSAIGALKLDSSLSYGEARLLTDSELQSIFEDIGE